MKINRHYFSTVRVSTACILIAGIALLCVGAALQPQLSAAPPAPEPVKKATAKKTTTEPQSDCKKEDATKEAAVKKSEATKKAVIKNTIEKVVDEKSMKKYTVAYRDTEVSFEMLPIPGGVFTMGSPKKEADRKDDEGPQHQVKIEPFWMGKCEVTWDEFDVWRLCRDKQLRRYKKRKSDDLDKKTDAVTRPTKEFRDMTFEMGHDGFPAICVTQFSASMYCKYVSAKTGHYYRLPTEAEWEYACRAGTTTAYSWGDDPEKYKDYAWSYENSDEKYHKVGKKKPNPWGLHDMHGNVAEWCLDQYKPEFYKQFAGQKKTAQFPVAIPTKLYPRVVRGGSWDDDPDLLRSASRQKSEKAWKMQDPQLPQSMWWHTDAQTVGFRIIRPLKKPTAEEIKKYSLEPAVPKDLFKKDALTSTCE